MARTTQRRLAAIVAADVVGYSRLMASDEEGTLAAVQAAYRSVFDPHFDQHDGRIVKTTGDGLLAEFPSVLDAVRCCVEIQRDLTERAALVPEDRRVRFRIGINLGDIIIDGDDIHGEGVNVAARLEAMAEPGGVCVSDDVQRQIRGKLDVPFTDDGNHTLKNIPEPVHVWRWSLATSTKPAIVDVSEPVPDFGGRPAIAVLPFENLSQDPAQEFLGDGIAQDILSRLAMWRWLPVIARNSSFTYKGRTSDAKLVGSELGARYILSGSVRRAGNRVRIAGQLTDTETGLQVWADRYDRDLEDIFVVQDEITDAIVAALEPAVGRAEMQRARLKNPQSLDAWDSFQRGIWHLSKITKQDIASAREMLERSVESDPNFARAHAGIGLLGYLEISMGFASDPNASLSTAHKAALRALRLDDLDPFANAALGYSSMLTGEHDNAIAAAQRAVEFNPSFALGHHCLHSALFMAGLFHDSLNAVERACRVSPNDPLLFYFMGGVSACHYMLRNYELAVEKANLAIQRYSQYPSAYRWLAVALAQSGRVNEARVALTKFLELSPGSRDAARRAYLFKRDTDLAHYLDGLDKAGLSEP